MSCPRNRPSPRAQEANPRGSPLRRLGPCSGARARQLRGACSQGGGTAVHQQMPWRALDGAFEAGPGGFFSASRRARAEVEDIPAGRAKLAWPTSQVRRGSGFRRLVHADHGAEGPAAAEASPLGRDWKSCDAVAKWQRESKGNFI